METARWRTRNDVIARPEWSTLDFYMSWQKLIKSYNTKNKPAGKSINQGHIRIYSIQLYILA